MKVSGRWLAIAVTILTVFFLLYAFGDKLAAAVLDVLDYVAGLGAWAPLLFVLVYVVATVTLVPGSLLTMAGGLLFGFGWGSLYSVLGAGLGSTAAFLTSRHLAREAIEKRLAASGAATGRALARIDRAIGRDGLRIVLLLRLAPIFPFVWLNYLLGLSRVRLRDYLLASFGMLPGTFLYVYYGTTLGSLAELAAGSAPPRGAGYWLLLAGGLLAALTATVLLGRIAGRALGEEEITEPGASENG